MGEARTPVVPVVIALALIAAGLVWYVTSNAPRAGSPVPGAPAPTFELASLDGGAPVSLESLRGKVVYVNLWATWCAPCRDEAPAMQRLYESLHDEGFEIIAPTIDSPADRAKVQAFREEFGVRYPILLDPDRAVYQQYGATGVPETYLVDPEGRLAEAYIGPRNWDDPRYARAIRELLKTRDQRGDTGG
jgi:peroxiredoxin